MEKKGPKRLTFQVPFPLAMVLCEGIWVDPATVSDKPIRLPNCARPLPVNTAGTNQQAAAEQELAPELPPYDKLRELAKKFPPPDDWFEEDQKPF
jgi:hypothetical protein